MFNLRKRKGIIAALVVVLAIMLIVPVMLQTPSEAASKKRPAKVAVTSVKTSGTNKVVIKWRKAKYATNYRIYWKQAGTKKWRTLATVKSNRTSYTHKSNSKAKLIGGKKYVYTVRAYNRYGRKWGAYNSKGKTVKIPKRKAAAPTKTPVKPKPTTPVKPTQPVKPIAVPTQKPKPTVKPAKPTPVPAKPTSTPAKPTEAPKPTATPAPVKVSSVTINPSTLKLTSKGQTAQLSVSVLPNNAKNKSITWNSSNTNVATVSSDGFITALANGNTTITATTLDGSGKSGSCNVIVEVPSENLETITIEGGKSNSVSIGKTFYPEITNFKAVTFEYHNQNKIICDDRVVYNSRSAALSFTALKQGQTEVIVKYNGNYLKKCLIVVTSNWNEYLAYESWRHSVESQIWTNDMSVKEKCDAAQNYIKTNFKYKAGYGQGYMIYEDKMCDCIGASNIMGDFAKDINCTVGYVNMRADTVYDYLSDAVAAGGSHIFTVIKLNGDWVSYDAQPQHN